MSKVTIMDHPLIQHKIGLIRRKETGSKDFRQLISEIAMLMCYEATRDLKLTDVEIDTPISHMTAKELAGKKLAVVPILRAGLGMVDGMLTMIPAAKVGHIGLYRNEETLEPVEYYCKLPQDCAERDVFVVDPMLATGGSSVAAITMLKNRGVKKIRFMCIVAAPQGIERMKEEHPDVDIYVNLIFHHRQRLAEVHAHSAHISHVGQRTGDQGVASDLLEHEKVLHAVCVTCLFDAAGIFQDRVVIQQIGVRQDHAILLPFNAQTHQRLVALHYGL